MKVKIDFIDSIIDFDNSNVYSFEIHNKKYLYRISSLFYSISNGDLPEEVQCFDKDNNELKISTIILPSIFISPFLNILTLALILKNIQLILLNIFYPI